MATSDVSALQFKFDTAAFDTSTTTEKTKEKPADAVTVPVGQQISEAKSKISSAIKNNNSLSSGLAGSGISSETTFNDKLFDIADVPSEVQNDSGFKSFMANLWGTKKAEGTKSSSKATTATTATAATAATTATTSESNKTAETKTEGAATQGVKLSDEKISELEEKVNNGGTLTSEEEKSLTASLNEGLSSLDADFEDMFPDFKPNTNAVSGAKLSDAAESTGVSAADIQSALDFTLSHQSEVNSGTVKDCADFKNLPANVQSYLLKQYSAAKSAATEN